MLKFQRKLQNFLSTVTIDSCPHAILLRGERGCGKKTFVKQLGSTLGLKVIDLTQSVVDSALEVINQIRNSVEPTIYYIDINRLSVKDQNALLRVIENPFKGSIFVLLSTSFILPTLINRCRQFIFEEYSKDDLKSICPEVSNELLDICKTPGQLLDYINVDLAPYQTLAQNMFNNFTRANISNILTISSKFKWLKTDEDPKLDFDLFSLLLLRKTIVSAKSSSACIPLCKAVRQLYRDKDIPNIDKRRLFDHFLITAKERGYIWC